MNEYPEVSYVVHAPALTVRKKDGSGYCATNIATCHQNGRWGLSFLCSGALTFLPWDEVAGVEYQPPVPYGRQHCDVCDGRLTVIPYGELETGAVVTLEKQPNGSWLRKESVLA